MYSRSSFIHWSKEMSDRPLTCQVQVMPGFTLRRRRCQRWYCFTSAGTGGLGPTMLISPERTFRNWGSSSSEVRRMKAPTRVTRGSFLILKTGPEASFCARRDSRRASASTCMLRNLSILKGRPFLPTRVWRKKTGPGESSLTAMAVTMNAGESSRTATALVSTSKARLKSSATSSVGALLKESMGSPSIWPRATCAPFTSKRSRQKRALAPCSWQRRKAPSTWASRSRGTAKITSSMTLSSRIWPSWAMVPSTSSGLGLPAPCASRTWPANCMPHSGCSSMVWTTSLARSPEPTTAKMRRLWPLRRTVWATRRSTKRFPARKTKASEK